MLPTLSGTQFEEWRAYNRLHPFGVDDTHMILCRMLATFINSHLTDGEKVSPVDLMPGLDMKEIWEEVEYQIQEEERRAKMPPRQRKIESMQKFLMSREAGFGGTEAEIAKRVEAKMQKFIASLDKQDSEKE